MKASELIWSEINSYLNISLASCYSFYLICLLDDKMELEVLMSTKVRICDKGFACLLCGRTMKAKYHMKSHLRDTHMKPRQYRCPPCNKTFTNRSFATHISAHHRDWHGIDYVSFRIYDEQIWTEITPFPVSLFPNLLCLLDDKMELEILMSTKVKFCDKGFACLLCGRTIKAKHHMKNHLKDTHMKPRQYKCPPCNKILTNRSIEKHVSKYHPDWHGIDIESFRIHEEIVGVDMWYVSWILYGPQLAWLLGCFSSSDRILLSYLCSMCNTSLQM